MNRLLIFKNGKIKITETFIVSNIIKLPFDITVLSLNEDKVPCVNNENPDIITYILIYIQRIYTKLISNRSRIFADLCYLRILRKYKIDVVLAQFGHSGAEIFKTCKLKKIPLIVYFRGFDVTNDKMLNKYTDIYFEMFKNCAATISVSRSIRNQIIYLGADPSTAFVAPSGADISLFDNNKIYSKKKNLLFVGRLVPKKAPHLLIEAFSKVIRKHPDAKLTMIGDGYLYGVCVDLIQGLKLQKSVEIIGFKNHETIKKYMEMSNVYVQHSVVAIDGDSEGTPVSILEAGASGIPVVSTKHAGITDAVIHGNTGFLVEERDVDSMAQYISILLDDNELQKKMGENAKTHIKTNYSQNNTIHRVANVISWAIDDRVKKIKPSIYPKWNHLNLK